MPRPALVTVFLFIINIVFLLAVIQSGIQFHNHPLQEFEEEGLVTWFSVALLVMSGLLCLAIYIFRLRQECKFLAPQLVWLIFTAGFIFLALDEKLLIHEQLDDNLKVYFHIEKNALNDRLDDFIVGLYGLAGIVIIYLFRRELVMPVWLRGMLVFGFVALFFMIVFDAVTNQREIVFILFRPNYLARQVNLVLMGLEDSLKILSESAFLVVFYGRLYPFLDVKGGSKEG